MNIQQNKQDLRKSNVRMGLILASVVLVFFVGFMVRMAYFGG